MIGTTEILTAPRRGPVEGQLEALKERLLRPIQERIANTALGRDFACAANEAAALAWLTVCPTLVLPMLLEEKIRESQRKWEKQQSVRRR